MVGETEIISSQETDPWYNLALEEYLFNTVTPTTFRLYLYVNDRSVVIGKNQNPWNECNVRLLAAEGARLARRITGGGAVYHDCGNVNYSFIAGRQLFERSKQLDLIVQSIRDCGIPAKKNDRHDLVIGTKKFSGNAFCYRKDTAIHHGTILLAADSEKLRRYLKTDIDTIQTGAVQSVRSEIVNLQAIQSAVTVESIVDSIIKNFRKTYSSSAKVQKEILFPEEESLYKRYSSWEWLYGKTPDFTVKLGRNQNAVQLTVKQGKIQQIVMDNEHNKQQIPAIYRRLEGIKFDEYSVNSILEEAGIIGV